MTTPEWKLECFDWLPIHRWTADQLITQKPYFEEKHYCKVCDDGVDPAELEKHATVHRNEMKKIKERRQKEALKKAQEARKLKKESKG